MHNLAAKASDKDNVPAGEPERSEHLRGKKKRKEKAIKGCRAVPSARTKKGKAVMAELHLQRLLRGSWGLRSVGS